jgi:hypothetical protein
LIRWLRDLYLGEWWACRIAARARAILTSTPLLDRVQLLRFPEVTWSEKDRPVLIADGRVFHVGELNSVVNAHAAYVVGVRQADFDRLCRFLRVEELSLYDMRVEDLSGLASFRTLTTLVIKWNTKAVSLAPIRHLSELRTLSIVHTPKVRDLDPIRGLTRLRALEFSGGMWTKNVANSLKPLGELAALEELALTNLRVVERGLRPLAGCRRLRRLELSNQFATADYAYLSIALPDVECDKFAPYIRFDPPLDDRDIMVIGSGKGFLNSRKDGARLKRYVADFRRLQEQFATERAPLRSPGTGDKLLSRQAPTDET